jgi:predicted DNA-binding WGR domain protein
MKRSFERKDKKYTVHWEITCEGTLVTNHSWGRWPGKSYTQTARFKTAAAARSEATKRAEGLWKDGFVEVGQGAKLKKPRLIPEGTKAVAAVKKALLATAVPMLRERGFEGTFPKFRRKEADRHSVVAFMWGRAQGHATVMFGVLPPKPGVTPAQDYNRAFNVRNRQRTFVSDLTPRKDWTLLHFDNAADKWGTAWAEQLAEHVTKLIAKRGIAWLQAPARRPGRS